MCVGTWITTSTSTPPVVQPQTLNDTFYFIGPTSTDNGIAAQGNGTPYAKWFALNKEVVTTFQGLPFTGNQTEVLLPRGRAYDFQFNPTNPQVSSPWHNVFYELCIDAVSKSVPVNAPMTVTTLGATGGNLTINGTCAYTNINNCTRNIIWDANGFNNPLTVKIIDNFIIKFKSYFIFYFKQNL